MRSEGEILLYRLRITQAVYERTIADIKISTKPENLSLLFRF